MPDPVEIPNPAAHPAVAAIRDRLDGLRDQQATARSDREALERDLGAGPGTSDEALEARLLARGQPTKAVGRLRELRRKERVLAQAADLVAGELRDADEAARRELTRVAVATVYEPAAKAAVRLWLNTAVALEEFRQLVDQLHAVGVGGGRHALFNQRCPLNAGDVESLAAFAAELIDAGLLDRADLLAAFPVLNQK